MKSFMLDDPAVLDDPWDTFADYRDNHPVYHRADIDQWFVFRYDHVVEALRQPLLSNERMTAFRAAAPAEWQERLGPVFELFEPWLFMKDGPRHRALRTWMQTSLSGDLLRSQSPAIEACVQRLLDTFDGREGFDLAREFAFILPLHVLAQVIGLPKDCWDRAFIWSVDITDFFNILPSNDDTCSRIIKSGLEFYDYTDHLVSLRRQSPQPDLLTNFLEHQSSDVSERDLISNTMVLLLAGHVAVRNLIGNTVWLLLQRPDDLARACQNPKLVAHAVDESLRYEAPVSMVARVAAQDFTLADQSIRKGQFVQLALASANRDPRKFEQAERYVVDRHPNPYLSFAPGLHSCLGAALSRQQTILAVTALLERYPRLRLDPERPIEWYRNAGNRGPESLYVRVD
jgi:cytochrome P450